MAAAGKRVKALESKPDLLEFEDFYLEVFFCAGQKVTEIRAFCELYGMTNEEIIEAIHIIRSIEVE